MNADTPARFMRRYRLLGIVLFVGGILSAALYLVSLDDSWNNDERRAMQIEFGELQGRLLAVRDIRNALGFGGVTHHIERFAVLRSDSTRDDVEAAFARLDASLVAVQTLDFEADELEALEQISHVAEHHRRIFEFIDDGTLTVDAGDYAHVVLEDDAVVRTLADLETGIMARMESVRGRFIVDQQALAKRGELRSLLFGLLALSLLALLVVFQRNMRRQAMTTTQAQQLDLLLAELPDAVVSCDFQGRIMRFNHAAENLFGYMREQVLGQSLSLLLPEEEVPHHDGRIKGFFEDPARRRLASNRVVAARTAAGRVIGVEVGLSAFDGPNGREAIAVLRNADERQALQREVARTQRLRAVGQLAAGVAHEFNNIMQVVSGASQLLAIENEANEPLTERIDEAVDRASDLTRKLSSYAQVEVQRPTKANWRHAVDLALDNLTRMTGGRLNPIQVEGPDDDWQVFADQERLASSLLQLLGNAQAASDPGAPVSLLVTGWPTGDDAELPPRFPPECNAWIMYVVQDQGCGIPAKVLEQIFDPFYSTRDVGEGTGLGLPMVRGFANQSGGQVLIESEVGAGTTASLRLPGIVSGALSGAVSGIGAKESDTAPKDRAEGKVDA